MLRPFFCGRLARVKQVTAIPAILVRNGCGGYPMLNVLTLACVFLTPQGEAEQWLKKMAAVFEKAPVSMDFEGTIDANMMGMQMSMNMSGSMVYKDSSHYRSNIEVATKMPDAAQQQGAPSAMDISILSVFDGQMMWVETHMKTMGMRTVTKMSPEAMAKMSEQSGVAGVGFGQGSMDPSKMIEMMNEMAEVTVTSVTDDQVVLAAVLTEVGKSKLGAAAEMFSSMTITLDKQHVFPMEFQAFSGDATVASFKYDNLEYLETVADELFRYEPPEGVMVQDMDAMLGGK